MKNLCTLSDYNYLIKGLTLYDSIKRHCKVEPFTLYYLCLDDECGNKLRQLKLPGIVPIKVNSVPQLKRGSKDYQERKNDKYGFTAYQEWCWSLSSRFCLWLVEQYNLPSVMYIDSDMCFYCDIHEVYLDIGPYQVGIVPHLHNSRDDPMGAYNVCVVFFGAGGYDCLRWWEKHVCTTKTKLYSKYGCCGDQKWLDLFEDKFDSVKVIGSRIAQTAPWNVDRYDWSMFSMDCRALVYNGSIRQLAFHHFSHFEHGENGYVSGEKNYGGFLSRAAGVRPLYDEYNQLCLETKKRYGL